MQGEAVASGSLHVDNISPSLFGGLVLTVGIDHPRVKQIPVPPDVRAVILHPHMFLSTKQARAILRRTVEMSDFVWQTANLAGFISGCYTNDLDMIRASFEDVVIEPQRQALIPGFPEVRARVDGGRRARLLDFGRRAHDVRVGAWTTARRRVLDGDARRVRASARSRSTSGSSRSMSTRRARHRRRPR